MQREGIRPATSYRIRVTQPLCPGFTLS